MSHRIVRVIVNGIAVLPLSWICVLYLFTALCWVKLGHFPIPSLDDPKYIGFSFAYYLAIVGMILVLPALLVWILLLPITIKHKHLSRKHLITMLVGSALAIFQLFADPFKLIYWLLD